MRTSSSLRRAAAAACLAAMVVILACTPLAAQSVTFTAPGSDTTWEAGSIQDITWRWSGRTEQMATTQVRLLYRVLPNGQWTEIGRTEAFRQQYRWVVPRDAMGSAQIRAIWMAPVPLTFNGPTFRISNRQRVMEMARGGVSRAAAVEPTASDYSIGEAFFEGSRPLSEGVMYDADAPNYMPLMVRIAWNGVAGRYGIQCDGHRLTVFDERGSLILFNPGRVPPVPAKARHVDMKVPIRLPRDLAPGSDFTFRVRLRPSDADCDANAANNERTFTTRLVRMGGNDLVVRIIEAEKVQWFDSGYVVKCVYEVMNVSGTESLNDVKARITVQGTEGTTGLLPMYEKVLRPGVWARQLTYTTASKLGLPDGGRPRTYTLVVTVDPDNEIRELREDNNTDGKRFVW